MMHSRWSECLPGNSLGSQMRCTPGALRVNCRNDEDMLEAEFEGMVAAQIGDAIPELELALWSAPTRLRPPTPKG